MNYTVTQGKTKIDSSTVAKEKHTEGEPIVPLQLTDRI